MSEEPTYPAPDDDAVLDLQEAEDEVLALKSEVAALKDQLLRVAAEAENTKRRTEREANDARAFAITKFARDLLDAADNLATATAYAPRDSQDPAVKNFVIGVEMTEKKLLEAFDRNGLKKLTPAAGEKFDPNFHQAMMEEASETVASGAVVKTLQSGYALFGRIVRPAMVVVAAKGSGSAAPETTAAGANPYGHHDDASGETVDTKA